MASKHDAKKARESFFQMQHDVARLKGQQFWMQKPKQPRIPPKVAAKPEPAPAEADAPATAADDGSGSTGSDASSSK